MILEVRMTKHGEWDMFYSPLQSHATLANQQVGHGFKKVYHFPFVPISFLVKLLVKKAKNHQKESLILMRNRINNTQYLSKMCRI